MFMFVCNISKATTKLKTSFLFIVLEILFQEHIFFMRTLFRICEFQLNIKSKSHHEHFVVNFEFQFHLLK